MIKLEDSQIAQILPEYFSDRFSDWASVKALSFAIYRAVERLIEYCGSISVFSAIDEAQDNVLDMLALDLNTQYYDDSLPTQAKRNLIKNTLVSYMSAGTPQAVEELVAAVFGEGKVQEWFEYGGDPFYFKITTNATMTPDGIQTFLSMIERVKSTRSHVERISVIRKMNQELFAGCATRGWINNTIFEGTVRTYTIQQEGIFQAAGNRAHIHNTIH